MIKRILKKKKLLIFLLVTLFILLLIIYHIFFSYSTFPMKDAPGSSRTIEEAKKLDVLLCEYIPDKKILEINHNIFKINNAWIEYKWAYSDDIRYPQKMKLKSGVSFIINTGESSLAKHEIDWKLEGFYNLYGGVDNGHTIVTEIDFEEFKDTIKLKILKFNKLTEDFTDSIGVLTLVRGECEEETE